MYKIDRRGGGVQKSFSRTDPLSLFLVIRVAYVCVFGRNYSYTNNSWKTRLNITLFLRTQEEVVFVS